MMRASGGFLWIRTSRVRILSKLAGIATNWLIFQENPSTMKLGAYSISLAVKDIHVSKAFYEKLGFVKFGGDIEKKYLIMKNGETLVGLFQGMFEGNILTFNPGWDQSACPLEHFDDVRVIQQNLKEGGLELTQEADAESSGPASIALVDPDGNAILIDQHR